MNVGIDWQTKYTYESAVRMVHTEVRVLPGDRWGQQVFSRSLTTDPETPVGVSTDAFGNETHRLGFLGGVSEITVIARAHVITPDGHKVWREELAPLQKYLALQETSRCAFASEIAAIADAAGASQDALSYAIKLMNLIADRFEFKVGATTVETTALDLIAGGAGVCQDFAHLMIAALRLRGIPAFYMSGYLAPPEGVEQTTASHAWAHAYIDGAWQGFDPANNQRQNERYVSVAIGRDYDDVPPIRGSIRGLAEEQFITALTVRAEQSQ